MRFVAFMKETDMPLKPSHGSFQTLHNRMKTSVKHGISSYCFDGKIVLKEVKRHDLNCQLLPQTTSFLFLSQTKADIVLNQRD